MASPKLEPLVLTDEERLVLESWTQRRKTAQVLGSWIVLACADGDSVSAATDALGVSRATAAKWGSRFLRERLEGADRWAAAGTATDSHR
jgi:transposase